jgi:uncharacterized protein (TIGR03435 family)
MNGIGRLLRRAAGPPADPATATDGQLLDRFLTGRDEAAFDLLVRRHGRMVLGVCRRILGNAHDAEDAFQVTFLVLARKGRGMTGWATVAGWLYRAACLTANKARVQAVRRKTREARAARPEAVEPTPVAGETSELDAEVARLPAKFRDVVSLCELGGKTRPEAAALLGIPEGTVSSRLATAHKLLADRLRRRGLLAPIVGLFAVAAEQSPAAVPSVLVESAARGAAVVVRFGPGSLSPTVQALFGEVTRAMSASKLMVWCGLAAATVIAAGGLAWAGFGGDPPPRPTEQLLVRAGAPAPKPPADEESDDKYAVGPPKAGEPEWMADFRKTYGLADGQALKFVRGDPFPDCRPAFLNRDKSPYPKQDQDQMLLVLTSDGRRIAHRTAIVGGYGWRKEQARQGIQSRLRGRSLWLTLADTYGLAAPRVEAPDDLLTTEFYADVVFQPKAPLEQVARSVQTELKDKFQIEVTATAREEEREVIVARGKYVHQFREGKRNGEIAIADRDLDSDVGGSYMVGVSDPPGLFRTLGEHVGRPVIDETDAASWRLNIPPDKQGDISSWTGLRGYRYPRRAGDDIRPTDASADREAVLKHLAAQTGVTFTTERRKVGVLAIKKAEK